MESQLQFCTLTPHFASHALIQDDAQEVVDDNIGLTDSSRVNFLVTRTTDKYLDITPIIAVVLPILVGLAISWVNEKIFLG